MNRRAFFSRVFGGVAAATLAPFLPKLLPAQTLGAVGAAPTVNGVVFPDAFAMVMDDLRLEEFRARYIQPAVQSLVDKIDQSIFEQYGGYNPKATAAQYVADAQRRFNAAQSAAAEQVGHERLDLLLFGSTGQWHGCKVLG